MDPNAKAPIEASQVLETAAASFGVGLRRIAGIDPAALHRPLALEPGRIILPSLIGGLITEPKESAQDEDSTGEWLEGKI